MSAHRYIISLSQEDLDFLDHLLSIASSCPDPQSDLEIGSLFDKILANKPAGVSDSLVAKMESLKKSVEASEVARAKVRQKVRRARILRGLLAAATPTGPVIMPPAAKVEEQP